MVLLVQHGLLVLVVRHLRWGCLRVAGEGREEGWRCAWAAAVSHGGLVVVVVVVVPGAGRGVVACQIIRLVHLVHLVVVLLLLLLKLQLLWMGM